MPQHEELKYGVFIVSDWYNTKAEAEKAQDEITEMARFAA